MMNLKETVFFRANAEYECIAWMQERDYTEEEITRQKDRFMSAYQIIEEAELEAEYEAWVREHRKEA